MPVSTMKRRLLAVLGCAVAILALGLGIRELGGLDADSSAATLTVRPLRVLDEQGAAVPGASVLGWRDDGFSVLAQTQADGTASFAAPDPRAPPAGLLVVAHGFAPRLVWAEFAKSSEPADVVLSPGAALTVQVTESSGAPLSGAVVRLCVPGTELADRSSRAGQPIRELRRMIDPATRRPYTLEDGVGLREWSAVADERGVARFVDLPSGVVAHANVADASGARGDRPVSLDALTEIQWVLPERVSVRGRVLDREGRPVAERTVWCDPAREESRARYFSASQRPQLTAKTDARGLFELPDVPAGMYHIGPGPSTREEHADVPPVGQPVVVNAELADATVELTVDRGLFVHGVVVNEAGEPLPEARLALAALDAGGLVHSTVAEDGSFRAGPLSAGEYELRATLAKCPCAGDPVRARAGEFGVLLTVRPAVSLRLLAQDEQGAGIEVAEVLIDSPTVGLMFAQAARGNRGEVRFDQVASGPLTVTVRTTDGRIGVRSGFDASLVKDEALRIVVGRAAKLRVTNGSRLESIEALVRNQDRAIVGVVKLRPGKSSEIEVPPGALSVEQEHVGRLVAAVAVEASLAGEVAVELPPRN